MSKRYNPEKWVWKGRSYKKGGKRIVDLRAEVETEAQVYGDDDGLAGSERDVEHEEI